MTSVSKVPVHSIYIYASLSTWLFSCARSVLLFQRQRPLDERHLQCGNEVSLRRKCPETKVFGVYDFLAPPATLTLLCRQLAKLD